MPRDYYEVHEGLYDHPDPTKWANAKKVVKMAMDDSSHTWSRQLEESIFVLLADVQKLLPIT